MKKYLTTDFNKFVNESKLQESKLNEKKDEYGVFIWDKGYSLTKDLEDNAYCEYFSNVKDATKYAMDYVPNLVDGQIIEVWRKGKDGTYMSSGTPIYKSDAVTERKITFKRKYTDAHPERRIKTGATVRRKILEFLSNNNGKANREEMNEFLSTIEEERGKTVSRSWFNDNADLVKVVKESGSKTYILTERGKKMLSKIMITETEGVATLDNTTGQGNVLPPIEDKEGSGDIFGVERKNRREKLINRLKEVSESKKI